jgi:hypothetical protein
LAFPIVSDEESKRNDLGLLFEGKVSNEYAKPG